MLLEQIKFNEIIARFCKDIKDHSYNLEITEYAAHFDLFVNDKEPKVYTISNNERIGEAIANIKKELKKAPPDSQDTNHAGWVNKLYKDILNDVFNAFRE